jgi:TolB-like protein/Tfp pilus assembly protein PilF
LTDPAAESTGDSTWARLSRRKVVQWGLAYLAGAWGLLQVLEFLSETYDWPPQLRMVAVPALLLGLPIVLVIAWYHGDRGHQRVTRTEFAILAVLVVIGGGVLWRYYEAIEARSPVSSQATTGQPPTVDAVILDDPRPSVAVLPFENRSDDPSDEYFVEGIHDDIVTQLTKVTGLRVIASTSTDRLRGTSLSAKEIGQQLDVSKLLQGRVQRAGDRVRINMVLVDAATESQEWAERYDRSVTGANVLAIQSEVAATVAARLKAGIPEEALAGGKGASTRNLEAWEAYQRAETAESLEQAEQYFRRAIEVDPRFALAYVGLSHVLVRQIYASGARRDVNLPEAEAALETALQLDPDLPEALAASAEFAFDDEGVEAAAAKLRKAIELNPNYAHAYEKLSDLMFGEGRAEEAVLYAKKGVALDPLSLGVRGSLAQSLEATGRLDEAEAQYRRAVDIDPSSSYALSMLAMFEAYVRGQLALGVTLQERAVSSAPDNAYQVGQLAMMYMDLEDEARATELIDDATNRWPDRTNVNVLAAILARNRGDQLASLRYASKVLETQPQHIVGIHILANADIARGDPEAARTRFAFAYPGFLTEELDELDCSGPVDVAAWILLANQESARAKAMLEHCEKEIGTVRLGEHGYGITDASFAALRGDKAGAIRALREAVKAGWRGPLWRGQLLFGSEFVPLQSDPGFQAVVAEIRGDIAKQRAELQQLRQEASAAP